MTYLDVSDVRASEYNGAGIYGLYNVIDDAIYIGKSRHIATRFSAHRSSFSKKQGSNPMYQEPVEKFVFCVLLKMSDLEFEQYGDLLESVFIIQARDEHHFKIYNSSEAHDSALYHLLSMFHIFDNTRFAIREALRGTELGTLRIMKPETREWLMEKINGGVHNPPVAKTWGR